MTAQFPDKLSLAVGHAFFDRWSRISKYKKLCLLLMTWWRPGQFTGIVQNTVSVDVNLTETEVRSYRIRIGRSLLHASVFRWRRLWLPLTFLSLSIGCFSDKIRSRPFQDVDIGLEDDTLSLSVMRKGGRRHAKNRQLALLNILEKLEARANLKSEQPSLLKKKPVSLLYVGGMPYSVSPSGYNLRTEQICSYLTEQGLESRILYMAYNRTVQREGVIDSKRVSFKAKLGEDGDLNALIDMSVEKIIQEAEFCRAAFIVAGSNWLNGYCALLAARRSGLPFLYDVRGLWHYTRSFIEPAFEKSRSYDFQSRAEFAVMRASDHVFTISSALKDIATVKGLPAGHISVVPNMIKSGAVLCAYTRPEIGIQSLRQELLSGDLDAVLIAYAGSLTPYEQLDIALNAVALANSKPRKARRLKFAIAGTGSSRPALERLANKLGVTDDIIWLGSRASVDIYSLIRAADIMVYPRSKHKTFQIVPPLKPLEPMLLGTACIMSDIGPHRDLAGKNNARALITPSENPANWLEAIYNLCENQQMRQNMTEAAQKWVMLKRDPKEVMQPWMNLINKMEP